MMFSTGTILVSSLALMTPWLQVLSNYPVATAGLVMAPRGIGNLASIVLGGRLSGRVDPRYLVGIGLLMTCSSFWLMTGWTPDVSQRELITAIVIQGAGLGLVFTPLQLVAFTTLAPSLRTEGASLFALGRNIGAAIGVSVTSSLLAHNAQGLHEVIGGSVTPFNRALQALGPMAHRAARSGVAAWRGGAGSGDQPAGADHCVCGRLRADDLHHPAGAAAAVADAPAAARGGAGEGARRRGHGVVLKSGVASAGPLPMPLTPGTAGGIVWTDDARCFTEWIAPLNLDQCGTTSPHCSLISLPCWRTDAFPGEHLHHNANRDEIFCRMALASRFGHRARRQST